MTTRTLFLSARAYRVAGFAAFALLSLLMLVPPAVAAPEIAIVQPAEKETIHSNLGDVTVRVRAAGGAGVRLLVDGKPMPHTYGGSVIQLHGVDRGAHTLQAELLDAQGNVLATSETRTFYLWHASRLFPHPKL